ELFAWSRFTHKNIAKLLGVAIFHGQICMVSPWIEPGNFYDYLNYMKNDGKRIDHFGLCIQIAEGLAYLHGERVIYGDLKAQNLLVNLEGILKFTDFGLSILSDSVPRFSSSKDHCGGSNRWMAPELLRELSPRSLEADMYAFGMEILTENIPFPERGEARLIHAILNESLIPLRPNRLNITSRRDSEWWSTLQQCWSRDRMRRPSIGHMLKMVSIVLLAHSVEASSIRG
ncbi:kinase-like protein, partial [Ceratobasidium sp. AG-I]